MKAKLISTMAILALLFGPVRLAQAQTRVDALAREATSGLRSAPKAEAKLEFKPTSSFLVPQPDFRFSDFTKPTPGPLGGIATSRFRPDPFELFGKPVPPVVSLDTTRFPEERAAVKRWKSDFPNLNEDFEVVGPSTARPNPKDPASYKGTYNCIAWSAGITDEWLNPSDSIFGFDSLYAARGFTRASQKNLQHEPGKAKIAVYVGTNKEGKPVMTHAARQEADGTWTSKLGSGPRIRHRTAEAVAGPSYGEPVFVYTKSR
jgi:hypothetical protein